MGNRLHVHIKHEIEYGNTSGFNWQISELEHLLSNKGCCINSTLNDDCAGDWEIEENEFKTAVKKIKKMSPAALAKYFSPDYAGKNFEELKTHVVGILEEFINTGDHHNGYYHFSWF